MSQMNQSKFDIIMAQKNVENLSTQLASFKFCWLVRNFIQKCKVEIEEKG